MLANVVPALDTRAPVTSDASTAPSLDAEVRPDVAQRTDDGEPPSPSHRDATITIAPEIARWSASAHVVGMVALYNDVLLPSGGAQLAVAWAVAPKFELFAGTRVLAAGMHPDDGANDIFYAVAWSGLVGVERSVGSRVGVFAAFHGGMTWRSYQVRGEVEPGLHPGGTLGASLGVSLALARRLDARVELQWVHNFWLDGRRVEDRPDADGPADVFGLAIALGGRYQP